MSFQCPSCQNTTLKISDRLELPPDSTWDEITLQIVECLSCRFTGLAVYQESRRGSLDDETIHHIGYRLSQGELKDLKQIIKKCPEPGNRRCTCTAHLTLNPHTNSGRWSPPFTLDWKTSFPLTFTR